MPLAGGIVQRGARCHGAQVGAGVGLGQDHRARDLAPREAGQDAGLGLRIGVFLDQRRNLLETVDGHQAALGPSYDFDHHLVDRLGQVQAAELARKHRPEQLGRAERVDGVLRGRGVGDHAVVELGAFLVRLGRSRCDSLAADLAQDLEDDAVVVLGVGVVARRAGEDRGLGVALLLEFERLAEVELLQPELKVRVVEEEVLAHSLSRWSMERSRSVLMIMGRTSATSPTIR